jgi:hypothetical protein
VLKLRCHGMSYLRVPVFCWTALHNVRGPSSLRSPDVVVDGVHLHLRHRRAHGRVACRAAGRLPDAQLHVPGSSFPQRHRRRGGVWNLCGSGVLVPQGLRIPPAPGLWDSGLLVCFRRFLGHVYTALRVGPGGDDATSATHQLPRMAAVALRIPGGRCDPVRGRPVPGDAVGGQHSRSRQTA